MFTEEEKKEIIAAARGATQDVLKNYEEEKKAEKEKMAYAEMEKKLEDTEKKYAALKKKYESKEDTDEEDKDNAEEDKEDKDEEDKDNAETDKEDEKDEDKKDNAMNPGSPLKGYSVFTDDKGRKLQAKFDGKVISDVQVLSEKIGGTKMFDTTGKNYQGNDEPNFYGIKLSEVMRGCSPVVQERIKKNFKSYSLSDDESMQKLHPDIESLSKTVGDKKVELTDREKMVERMRRNLSV